MYKHVVNISVPRIANSGSASLGLSAARKAIPRESKHVDASYRPGLGMSMVASASTGSGTVVIFIMASLVLAFGGTN
jgi:hypothetical protein